MWQTLLIQIASMLGGTVFGALNQVVNLVKSGFQTATKFHQEGIAFARTAGLSARQAQAYTEALTQRTEVLAAKYGVAAEAIREIQRGITNATGRQLLLNDAQTEGLLQLNKLVGSQVTSKFTSEIMNNMGGQLSAVQGAVSKAYATAARQGLEAQKFSQKVAENLGMANRLSFRNGIDGLTRMAAMSEKLGINMQSVENATKNFLELDKAIEHAAQLQMLGGSAAAMFGNPLTASYEANYDPEAFAKRMSDALGSYANFDKNKGYATINGMNMDFVRNIANAMGISVDDASKMAKKQAEVGFKEAQFGGAMTRISGGNEAKRNYILNNSTYNTEKQRLEVNGRDINDITDKEWGEMLKFNNMTEEQIMREQATQLTSINEILKGISDSIGAMFASFVNGIFPGVVDGTRSIGTIVKDKLAPMAQSIGKAVGDVAKIIYEHREPIKSIAKFIIGTFTNFVSTVLNNWKIALASLAAIKIGGAVSGIGGARGFGGKVGGGAAKGAKGAAKLLPKLGRLAKGLGIAGLVGLGGEMLVDNAFEGSKNEGGVGHGLASGAARALSYGSAGAMIGSFIPGIGTALGAGFGALAGAIHGYIDARDKKSENHAEGGIVGGNSYSGDKIRANLDSGEMVINRLDQSKLFNFIKGLPQSSIQNTSNAFSVTSMSPLTNTFNQNSINTNGNQLSTFISSVMPQQTPIIEAKPIGEKEYIYTPRGDVSSKINGNTITVKDFNINLSGTLKIDGGSSSTNIDTNKLLNDHQFMSSLKELIKNSINNDMNGGRFMNDLATMRGQISSASIVGR